MPEANAQDRLQNKPGTWFTYYAPTGSSEVKGGFGRINRGK